MGQVSSLAKPTTARPSRPGVGTHRTYLLVQTRSAFACLLHWLLVGSVATLAVTGFYIADPFDIFVSGEAYNHYVMGKFRLIHFIAAGVMMAAMLTRFYLAFTPSCNKDIMQTLPTPWNVVHAMKLAWSYLTGSRTHEHYRFINPLGGIGVFSIMMALALMIMTGVLLYLPGASTGVWGGLATDNSITWLGTQQNVRLIHHTTMYVLGFFVVIHIYMQLWKNSVHTESDLSSIIGGYKIFPMEEIGHFDDHYGIHRDETAPTEEEMNEASTPMEKGPGYH